jgi:predicted anti-sigma-YlaC factor YlaD
VTAGLACERVRVLMEAYVDGELAASDPNLAEGVRAHLATCEDCRRQHDHAVSLPFRMKALRSPSPPPALISNVMRAIAPAPRTTRRVWAPLAPEMLLVAFIVWYVSGLDGLTSFATGTWSDLQALAVWSFGASPPPSVPAADLLLLGALIALSLTAAYHLSVLARISGSAAPPAQANLRKPRQA